MKNQAIFEKMIASGFNDIVGGSDPVEIAQFNVDIIERISTIEQGMKVLDFGCGCGRVSLPILEKIGPQGTIVGVDIIPKMIEFCREEITSIYPNSNFYQLVAENSHYTQWTETQAKDSSQISDLTDIAESEFDLIFAFSVFTHLDLEDTKKYLKQFSKLLRPGGSIVISAMFINESSMRGLHNNTSNVPFGKSIKRRRDIYFGNPQDKLAAVGFREASFIKLAVDAGLEVSQIYYGAWPGRPHRICGQDVIALTNHAKLPDGFDAKTYIELHADLTWDSNTPEGLRDAERHYLLHGYYEGRAWC